MPKRSGKLSIFKLIFASFCLVSIIPVGIIAYNIYNKSWEQAWTEATEKHQLLAINLTKSISLYVQGRSTQLGYLAKTLSENEFTTDEKSELLASFFKSFAELSSLAYVKSNGELAKFLHDDTDITTSPSAPLSIDAFASQPYFIKTRDEQVPLIEAIITSPFTNKPTIIITKPIVKAEKQTAEPTAESDNPEQQPLQNESTDVLIAELNIAPIEELRRSIKFGTEGQPTIFDPTGKVIAHANSEWMTQMKDLSVLPVVKKMLDKETGVTEYFMPGTGVSMVAGYTFIPRLNWGVMVDQPKSEITRDVQALLFTHFKWTLGALLCAIILAIPLARWITKPINSLATSANSVTRNNFVGEISEITGSAPKEIVQLGNTIRTLISGLRTSKANVDELNEKLQIKVDEATRELISTNRKLEKIAETDFLTGLANRRFFEAELEGAIDDFKTIQQTSALLYIDLDNFKLINDTYGHVVGDAVLQKITGQIKECTDEKDLVARLGGDECAVLIRNSDEQSAMHKADKICRSVSEFREDWNSHQIRLTVSIGMLMIDSEDLTRVEVLRQADASCYLSKVNGGNSVWKYDKNQPEIRKHWGDLELLNIFSDSMKENRLNLALQPIVAVHTKSAFHSYEVLLRLFDKNGKVINTDTFLPAVIQYKLMPDLDRWVVAKAFEWMSQNQSFPYEKLFINISAQTLEEGNFLPFIEKQRTRHDIDCKNICFEITETIGIDNLEKTAEVMKHLTESGFSFALDDFGSGLSSFQYLKELPIDMVKIDGNFIRGAVNDKLDRKIIRSIVSVCHSQGIRTVAECVESKEIYQQMLSLNIDYAQGFYIGAPKPVSSSLRQETALAS